MDLLEEMRMHRKHFESRGWEVPEVAILSVEEMKAVTPLLVWGEGMFPKLSLVPVTCLVSTAAEVPESWDRATTRGMD